MAHLPSEYRPSFEHWLDLSANRSLYNRVKQGCAWSQRCIVPIIKGTKSNVVNEVLKKIPEYLRMSVEEVTLDFSENMQNIVEICFSRLCAHLTDSIIGSSVWKPYKKYVGNTVVNRSHKMPMLERRASSEEA